MTLSNWIASHLINITSIHLLRIFVSIIKSGVAMMSLPCISVNRSAMCNHLVRSFVLSILFFMSSIRNSWCGSRIAVLQRNRFTLLAYFDQSSPRWKETQRIKKKKKTTRKNYYYLRTTDFFFFFVHFSCLHFHVFFSHCILWSFALADAAAAAAAASYQFNKIIMNAHSNELLI